MLVKKWRPLALVSTLILCAGCSSSSNVELVDLNKVLTILAGVLDSGTSPNGQTADAGDTAEASNETDTADTGVSETTEAVASGGGGTATAVVPVAEEKDDPAAAKKFCDTFAAKLNEAKLISSPLGVSIDEKGDIHGFTDANRNNIKDATDKQMFTVQIDAEGERLIASDDQGNRRPHHYRSHGTGFLLGMMLGRQSRYYSGSRAASKPNFRTQTMSPTNYHSSAVARARARSSSSGFKSSSSSSRSRSGSGGFSFGK